MAHLVLSLCCLSLSVGAGTCMAKLHLRAEQFGACANAPGHHGFEQPTRLESITNLVFLYPSHLSVWQEKNPSNIEKKNLKTSNTNVILKFYMYMYDYKCHIVSYIFIRRYTCTVYIN